MMKIFLQASIILMLSVALCGCTAMDRFYQKTTSIVAPEKTTLQGGIRWMTPPLEMGLSTPTTSDQMTVFLRVKNSSGSELPDLRAEIRQNLENAGYKIINSLDQANFYLIADARYFGENTQRDNGGTLVAGGAIGAATGAIIGHSMGKHAKTGAIGGAAVGAAAASILANRNRMIEIDLVVDIRIGERIKGGIKTTKSSDTRSTVTQAARQDGEGGGSKSTSTQQQKIETTEQFLFRSNRIVAHATKMGLTPEEGLPFLSSKITAAIGSSLP